ncbi:uncharacterized protein LY79DRAFT_554201 [Colletotrichum navitas]|uniref:Uncharacterized protein n=1 Tax=Colletotrichum navitas TaxID=681940 RepID=A0AAD8PZR8_9PEZI|nr:uncharacterized protein LY79DRAFT_554201 [Colletotrichum navitas]KAK1590560.1 hypothetical protein LY79DRAFT_554201 [Colletotrichum navitas]
MGRIPIVPLISLTKASNSARFSARCSGFQCSTDWPLAVSGHQTSKRVAESRRMEGGRRFL